jgi:serine/threonine protein kinase
MGDETRINPQTLAIGEMLEEFRIDCVLGQGGFGITYKATDETLRRLVAIKEYLPQQFAFRDGGGVVRPRRAEDEEMFRWGLNRFVDEARTLAMFRHPNIVSVIRYFAGNGTAYLVMEFEEGQDLKKWRAQHGRPDEPMLRDRILAPLLEGLARVHGKGLLHRDIKPDNIFIREDGSPVLIDFGASRALGADSKAQLTSIVSAGYSPFEQYGSGERQGPWSDLYALAGTMYWLIAGNPPADAIAREQGAPLIPATEIGAEHYSPALLQAIDKALALAIEDRPQDAREMLARIDGSAAHDGTDDDVTVVRRRVSPKSPTQARPRRAIAIGALVATIASAGIAGWWMYQPTPQRVAMLPPAAVDEAAATAGDEASIGAPEILPVESDPSLVEPSTQSSDTATAEPTANETTPPAPSEDDMLMGLRLPAGARRFRADQLSGALLAYTSIRSQFDACREQNCDDLPELLTNLQAAMESQTWRREEIQGTITISNPRRLDSESCPFMIDLLEQLIVGDETVEQERTYCTRNGLDRMIESAGDIVRA